MWVNLFFFTEEGEETTSPVITKIKFIWSVDNSEPYSHEIFITLTVYLALKLMSSQMQEKVFASMAVLFPLTLNTHKIV